MTRTLTHGVSLSAAVSAGVSGSPEKSSSAYPSTPDRRPSASGKVAALTRTSRLPAESGTRSNEPSAVSMTTTLFSLSSPKWYCRMEPEYSMRREAETVIGLCTWPSAV